MHVHVCVCVCVWGGVTYQGRGWLRHRNGLSTRTSCKHPHINSSARTPCHYPRLCLLCTLHACDACEEVSVRATHPRYGKQLAERTPALLSTRAASSGVQPSWQLLVTIPLLHTHTHTRHMQHGATLFWAHRWGCAHLCVRLCVFWGQLVLTRRTSTARTA